MVVSILAEATRLWCTADHGAARGNWRSRVLKEKWREALRLTPSAITLCLHFALLSTP